MGDLLFDRSQKFVKACGGGERKTATLAAFRITAVTKQELHGFRKIHAAVARTSKLDTPHRRLVAADGNIVAGIARFDPHAR